jgi:hypothetical protein
VSHNDGRRGKLGDELVARAQAFFERKAGRPVTPVEAEEWLLSLIDYFAILRRWSENPPSPVEQDEPMVAPDTQGTDRRISRRKNRRSMPGASMNTRSRVHSDERPGTGRDVQEGSR